jgi:hypothetical protein
MIDTSRLHGTFAPPITEGELATLAALSGSPVPKQYEDLLRETNGLLLDNGIKVYSSQEVMERNATFEVAEYAPGYMAIGDDSGGVAFLLRVNSDDQTVYAVGHGSMDPDDMKCVAPSLDAWLQSAAQSESPIMPRPTVR